MTDPFKITVVIPARNEAAGLRRTAQDSPCLHQDDTYRFIDRALNSMINSIKTPMSGVLHVPTQRQRSQDQRHIRH